MNETENSERLGQLGQSVRTRLVRYENGVAEAQDDFLAVEEPLEIAVSQKGKGTQTLTVTLRTPGSEEALAVGFLLGEGVIRNAEEVSSVSYKIETEATLPAQRVTVRLRDHVAVDFDSFKRNFPISAACGACGKSALEALKVYREDPFPVAGESVLVSVLQSFPRLLEESQSAFEQTGALHAAGRFDRNGNLLALAEDVGRHNALDKLVGKAALAGDTDWTDDIMLFSGRVGFDLMQKAIGAGCPFIVSVGAPSSFAVELANLYKVTLVGFLREKRFNVYSTPSRIQFSDE